VSINYLLALIINKKASLSGVKLAIAKICVMIVEKITEKVFQHHKQQLIKQANINLRMRAHDKIYTVDFKTSKIQ
jgi:uncharacterized membrane protein YjfL (UPF0719 family)